MCDNKENETWLQNKGISGKNCYHNKNKKKSQSNSENKPKVHQEPKFHMHDAEKRKVCESFENIKDTIVLKIQKYLLGRD